MFAHNRSAEQNRKSINKSVWCVLNNGRISHQFRKKMDDLMDDLTCIVITGGKKLDFYITFYNKKLEQSNI